MIGPWLLGGAFARIKRADEHLTNLQTEIGSLRDEDAQLPIDNNFAPKVPDEFVGVERYKPLMSVLVGEVTYNLRSALDYLVYALAWLDSGSPQDGTQFPIEDTPDGFAGRTKTYLKGINADHVAAIKALQPCSGCHWAKLLRTFSNPDKHRHLIRLREQETIWLVERPTPKAYPGAPEVVNVDYAITRKVAFDDGTPVIHTLECLVLKVRQTIEAFKPDFEGGVLLIQGASGTLKTGPCRQRDNSLLHHITVILQPNIWRPTAGNRPSRSFSFSR